VTATGSHTQPIQWSSEMWDSELGLVYYNWRYYNSIIGRWISYDPANYLDLYFYLNPTWEWDNLGLRPDINYLSKAFKKDVLSEFDSAEVYINEPSYFVITAHGTAHFITDSDNNLMSPLELANKMIEAGYRFDKTVKLLACNTGKLKNGFAQQLANHLYLIWKKSYQHIKKPHIIINAPETLTIISYFDDKDRRFYKIYSAEETPFISINPITNENIVEYRSELILKSFKPCK
jgi:RHS repeat-associated protein